MSLDNTLIGVDVTKVAIDGIAQWKVGTRYKDSSGIEYVYVSTTAALVAYQMYPLTGAYAVTTTAISSPASTDTYAIGVPQVACAAPVSGVTYNYMWVAVRGPLTVFAAAGCAKNLRLYTCSYTGTVHTTAQSSIGSAFLINSVLATAASLASQIYAVDDLRIG